MAEKRFSSVMAADVVGYSRMMGADEDGTLERVKRWRREVFEPAVAARQGRIVKLMGDGALVVFDAASDAVLCGLAVQRTTPAFEDSRSQDDRIQLRIGVSCGDVLFEDGDVFGDVVNIAARLEGMAPPGGLLVSESVWIRVQDAVDVRFHDNGLRKFKNIARAINAWSWPDKLPPLRADQRPRIHLTGFAGSSPQEQQLATGLDDELRAHLARLTGLEVASSADAAHFRVGGRVRLAAGRCRIHAQLDSIEGDRQVWAERYEEANTDPFELIDGCVPRVVMGLRRKIAQEDAERLRDRPLDELSAPELLALGGASFFNPTLEGWQGGGILAEQALQIAPDHFMALGMAAAGLGLAEPLYGHRVPPARVTEQAFERIEEALRRNNRSDMLHAVHCGLLLYGRGQHASAEAAAMRSLEINPDYNMALWMRGAVLVFSGRADAGCECAERAVAIHRSDPYLHLYCRVAGYGHLEAGRPELAVQWLDRADHLAPGLAPNLIALAVAQQQGGNHAGAGATLNKLLRDVPGFRVRDLAALPYAQAADWSRFQSTLLDAGAHG